MTGDRDPAFADTSGRCGGFWKISRAAAPGPSHAISTHLAVEQVAGIPHPTWGEQVHAMVVLHPGCSASVEDLKDHARRAIAGKERAQVDRVPHRTDPLVRGAETARA